MYDEEAKLSRAALDQILPSLVLLLGPFAPYLAEELWEQLGRTGPVFRQPWPAYDEELAKEDAAEVVLQVNGKVRGRIVRALRHAARGAGEARAGRPQSRSRSSTGKQVVKVIVVPDKLVNIVVR